MSTASSSNPAGPGRTVTVQKMHPDHSLGYRYEGRLLSVDKDRLVLEATFNRPDHPVGSIVLVAGDRFRETYFFNRWYNILEVHTGQDGPLKAWYCNLSRPAQFTEETVTYVDLYLDLLVYPDGGYAILDQDEYARAVLTPQDRRESSDALAALLRMIRPDGLHLD